MERPSLSVGFPVQYVFRNFLKFMPEIFANRDSSVFFCPYGLSALL